MTAHCDHDMAKIKSRLQMRALRAAVKAVVGKKIPRGRPRTGSIPVPGMSRCWPFAEERGVPPGFMLDTTVFNHILRDGHGVRRLRARGPLFVTLVQRDELEATTRPSKRAKLLALFNEIQASPLPTNEDEGSLEPLLLALNRLNGGKPNNPGDARIAETAIRNGLGLVTDDNLLAAVVRKAGGYAISLRYFLRPVARS